MSLTKTYFKEPSYFHREYYNDTRPKYDKTWLDQTKRIAITALPFAQAALNSYKPASFALALGCGGMRVYTTSAQLLEAIKRGNAEEKAYCLFQTTIAVISLAGTIFAHPAGMLISTGHDLIIELSQLIQHLKNGDKKKAIESCLNIINSSLYFALFLHGGLEMTIASLAMQILIGLYRSQKEFKNEHWIEAVGHLGMSLVRGNQMTSQIHTLQKIKEIKAFTQKPQAEKHASSFIVKKIETSTSSKTAPSAEKSVGKLGEKWRAPSDHLPVGTKIGNTHVISWNVLNKNFMSWIYKDTQGLNGSLITELDVPSPTNPNLTQREDLIIKQLHHMMNDPEHPQLVLGLQECHPEFAKALQQSLPAHMGIVTADPSFTQIDQNVTIYSKDTLTFLEKESSVVKAYPSDPIRPLMDLTFQENTSGQKLQVINAHVPGNPHGPGRWEIASYLLDNARKDCVNIALGDMNFSHEQMSQAFVEEAAKRGISSSFNNLVDYNTIVSPDRFEPHAIDHIWVSTHKFDLPCSVMRPSEILPEIRSAYDLLDPAPSILNSTDALKNRVSTTGYGSWEKVVEYAREHFPQEGKLMIKPDGFAYVKVDDEYIHTLFPMLGLKDKGFMEPPYFRSSDAPGAHISVFYENEQIRPQEIDQIFHFKLKQITFVNPTKGVTYAVLQVESPELEALRQKYGLSPKLFGHDYHISLAKKKYLRQAIF
jgi:hypothetical protein